MEADDGYKHPIFIKTKFGAVSVHYFNRSPIDMINDEQWREAVGAEGGVFSYVPWEWDIPY